ncbi:DUF4129 domain-containing protein [Mycobacterium haemophilum]|uniref:Protein-glutamine gamma-glutamyltransferase-like C-terminal domain-containing protein n=1 Tax=Mycobacterium haemophilum TaxID=29311 RepID=A0A0I9ZTK5_9MYCO|nr:DUF4129 domain-containing protein [Mycobacterium haemophilum]KLO33728.1 hypothetical protein ABH39_01015 [Mycobacterium haemophilum]KLO39254.1 hypothetical protein ABH38_01015 [Mycobacterium haemophilum]KLO45562.1 hypothetical protein ABH37_01020 [Mycobacterium haemophilum]KLO56712.1 hypothetical protein ABH36_01015 [Mycobacterium haemophilum]
MPGIEPGIDRPTRRVVVLIVLLILVAAALRGYLPVHPRELSAEPGSSLPATILVVAALAVAVALLVIAVIARLREPPALAPSAGELSDTLGGGTARPSWRVLLIGLAVIVAWLLVATLLSRLFALHNVNPSASIPDSSAPPKQPNNDAGDMVGILLASTVLLFLITVVAAAITSRRRWRAAQKLRPATIGDDDVASRAPAKRSELLARAAELGLAAMSDLTREPRQAIIACYVAMERELANVPGAVPQDCDTSTEVLARAVEHHALHADNAVELVKLFEEARFSQHVMNERHREVAVQALRLVLTELRSPA